MNAPRVGNRPVARLGVSLALALGFLLTLSAWVSAHEIPSDVTIRSFVKAEGTVLRFLVRVPLAAMRDFEWPVYGPGYLDLEAAHPLLPRAAALWIAQSVEFYENALAHVKGARLPPDTELVWQQAMLDVLLEYPIASESSDFAVNPRLANLGMRTTTVLRFVLSGERTRDYQYNGDPGLLRLDPRWYHAATRFVVSGIHHILSGIDHLLFLLCLVVPLRSVRRLVPVVTSFTVAHSITLIASAFGIAPATLWFAPLIEWLIALSIVYMAFENIIGARLDRRWLITFGFGLVHGFGFSFVLKEQLQFGGSHLLTSLLAFNVGVEIGQVLVLVLMIPLLHLLFHQVVQERVGVILLSALAAHTAWHWSTERGQALLQYDFQLPALNWIFLASVLRWLMLFLIVVGVLWAMYELFRRWNRTPAEEEAAG